MSNKQQQKKVLRKFMNLFVVLYSFFFMFDVIEIYDSKNERKITLQLNDSKVALKALIFREKERDERALSQ